MPAPLGSDEWSTLRSRRIQDGAFAFAHDELTMRLTLTTFLTIDGVMQPPAGPTEDGTPGFDLGGWLVPFADIDMGAYVTQGFADADAFLLDRQTYEIMHSHWPKVTDANDMVATKLNHKPKYVVTKTLHATSWAHTQIVDGDLETAVKALKRQPGLELQVHGSRPLARSLHNLGLIDEYRLWIFPVVLGKGYRLFDDRAIPTAFQLIDTKTTSTGVSVQSFVPFGASTYGEV
jgi:dihydrofolate reductase